MVGPREQVIVAGAFPLYMAVFVWRLYRDRFRYQLAINQLAFIISRIDFYFASGFKLKKVMDANTNITFEQMPQALAEVLSSARLGRSRKPSRTATPPAAAAVARTF